MKLRQDEVQGLGLRVEQLQLVIGPKSLEALGAVTLNP